MTSKILQPTNNQKPETIGRHPRALSFSGGARLADGEVRNQKRVMINTIIFDLGNVLIDWNVHYLYDKIFSDKEKRDYFLSNICTPEWHAKQDAGRPVSQATNELVAKHPEWKEEITAFYSRWNEMFGGAIEGSVEILKELKKTDLKLYALTNWSAELFKHALAEYDFLHWFHGRVVSGEEGINKPEQEVYKRLLQRFAVDPRSALFIDDKEYNVDAAVNLGMDGIIFISPGQLRTELEKRSIL
jgi:2-haloacid dehalogenase